MAEDRIAVVVADDEWHYREAVVHVLSRADDMEVVGEAATAEEALALVAREAPAVALVDLQMPEMGGLELARRIRAEHAGTAVVIFTVSRDESDVLEALRTGASGYLVKQETRDPGRLYEAVRVAASGATLLSPGGARELIEKLAHRGSADPADEFGLTKRECEVLRLLADGASNRQIAMTLVISEQAIKNHVGSVLRKLGVSNRTAAAAVARRAGLTSSQ